MTLSVLDAAIEYPDRIALVTNDRSVRYDELAASVTRTIASLRREGVVADSGEPPRPVAVEGATHLASVTLLLALIAAGVPAAVLHPRWTRAERARWLEATGIRQTLTPSALATDNATPTSTPPVPDDDRPLAVLPTSGTTGSPRAVLLSRRAFVASARASALNLGWQPEDRWLANLPLAHVGGLSILTRCLIARRTAVLVAPTRGEQLAAAVEQHGISLLSLVPPLLQRLFDIRPSWQLPRRVRAILVGGAALPNRLRHEAAARGWPVLATYGLTEACSQVATQRCNGPGPRELGAGVALPGTQIRIVDGRIQIRGPTLFSGYLPSDPHAEPSLAGWFDTGDLGSLDADGRLHVLGRQDDLIVTGGENVSPLEVEAALEACPGVVAACVFGVPSERWGRLVAAAIVTEPGTMAPLRELIAPAGARLAPFKLPRQVALLDELELRPSGKVDRRATARRAAPLLREPH